MELATIFRFALGGTGALWGFYMYVSAFQADHLSNGVREVRAIIGPIGMLAGMLVALQPLAY